MCAQDRKLFHRRRAVGVEGGHQHAFAFAFLEAFCEFGGCCGFTGALQTDHEDRCGGVVDLEFAWIGVARQDVLQFVVHDFDDLLAGLNGFGDGLACRLFLDGVDEVARNGQGNVGLEQGHADLAQRCFHVILRERTLFGELVKDA